MEWHLKHTRTRYERPTIRAGSKRRYPYLRRNWIVETRRGAVRWIGGSGGEWVITTEHLHVTCDNHSDAVEVASAIAHGRLVDPDLIINLSRRWGR